ALDRLAFCGISSLTMTPFLHFFHPTRLPSGVIDSSAVIRSAFFAPERFAPERSAPYRFAPERFARELTAASTASFHESVSMANKTAPPQRDLTSNFMPSAFRFRSDRTSQDPA